MHTSDEGQIMFLHNQKEELEQPDLTGRCMNTTTLQGDS